jgi:small-conductance mechanosensitive channel
MQTTPTAEGLQPPVRETLVPLLELAAWQQLVVVVAAAVAAKVVNAVSALLVRRITTTESGLDEVAVQELRLPLYVTVVFGAVYYSTGIVARLPVPFEWLPVLAGRLAVSGIVLAWTYGAIRFGRRGLEAVRAGGTQYQFAPILKNVWTFGLVVATVLTLIAIWGVSLTPLLAAGGIIGIVVGIAAQDTNANFIGGISLFFDNTYKIGDFVHLESGEKGSVVNIGIRSTTVLTPDYMLVTVPNSVLNTVQVINQSAPERRMRIRVDVRVPYGADLDVAEACMFEASAAADSVLESPEPQVRIQQYAERGIEYELLVHVPNPIRQVRARHGVYRALTEAFRREGIEPAYSGRTVRFEDRPEDATTGPTNRGR